jgi:hypothetical protein
VFIVNSLVLGSIVLMLARVYQPWVDRPRDAMIPAFKVPLRARIRIQRFNAYVFVGLMILAAIGGWLSAPFELFALALAMIVMLLPVRYTLTDEGVVLGRTAVRRWVEFSGMELKPGHVRLKGAGDWRDMEVWLPRSGEDDAVIALLRRRTAASRVGGSASMRASGKPATGAKGKEAAARA